MATARCDGVIVTDVDGYPACQDLATAPLAWVSVEPFSIDEIDGEVAAGYFAVGFVMYATGRLIGLAVRTVLEVIRR